MKNMNKKIPYKFQKFGGIFIKKIYRLKEIRLLKNILHLIKN
jgi:hypothetical protein